MVRVGLVGIGFMGWIHYLAWQNVEGVEIAGFCSSDAKKRQGDWTGIQGNFGPPGSQIDITGMKVTASLEDLLKDRTIDLIDICSPAHAHADYVRKSLQAGKHVICEKPLALDSGTAQQLADLAKSKKLQLMVAHVLPFLPEFAFLVEAARKETYGKILTAHFRRVIGPPDWVPDFYDPARVGGPLIDLHVHDAHLMRLLLGMPSQVTSRAIMRGDVPKYVQSLFDFADGRFASATSGVTDTPARPFGHAYDVQFERATLQFETVALKDVPESLPLKVLHSNGEIERPVVGSGDPTEAFTTQLKAAADMVTGKAEEPILDGRLAADAITICQAQIDASKSKKTVVVSA